MVDYIPRSEAINELRHRCYPCGEGIEAINVIPAADVAPVVHARWITRSDKGIISMTHPYMCSRCWRVEMDKEPYCNCGAKMDGGDSDAGL